MGMTAQELLKSISDEEIKIATNECLAWQRTGVLTGNTVRNIADRLVQEIGLAEEGILRDTDTLVMCEAACRFAAPHDSAQAVHATAIEETIFDQPSGDVRGTVVAFADHKGKRKRIAHAFLLVGKEPAISLEIPQKTPVADIHTLCGILKEFSARVTKHTAE